MAPAETEERTKGAPVQREPQAVQVRNDVERFPIPLVGEGKSATIELPKGWTTADVRKMIHVIDAMFLWEAEGGGAQKQEPLNR